MKPGVILSMEQALSLTSATLRFVHLGWRVIKLEATPQSESALPGDPNRYIGSQSPTRAGAPISSARTSKVLIALNLKSGEGRDVLHRLIRESMSTCSAATRCRRATPSSASTTTVYAK